MNCGCGEKAVYFTKKGVVYRLLARDGKKAYNQHGFAEHPKELLKQAVLEAVGQP